MVICDFTMPELEVLRAKCNFTNEEMLLFNFRSKGIPLETCAEMLNVSVSTAKARSQKINRKIMRILKDQ